jgi:hypothetical protein
MDNEKFYPSFNNWGLDQKERTGGKHGMIHLASIFGGTSPC